MRNFYIITILLLFLSACESGEEKGQDQSKAVVSKSSSFSSRIEFGEIPSIKLAGKISCSGVIEIPPSDFVSIHSRTAGFVGSIHFLPGDYVRKGQMLVGISNPHLIEKQRLFLETKADYELKTKDFRRKEKLFDEKAINEKAYDEAKGNMEILKARYEGLKTELGLLGMNVGRIEKEGKLQSRIRILAPTNGYIHEVQTNKGAWIEPQTQLMEIAGKDHIHLEIQVPSRSISQLEKGQEVEFTIPGSAESFSARIEKINPMLDRESNSLQVHCHIAEDATQHIKAGMRVQAWIETTPQELKALPLEAVVKEGENYYAFKKTGEETMRVQLVNPMLEGGYVTFGNDHGGEWVIGGAYYVE